MSDLIDRQNAIDVLEILADKMSEEGAIVMTQAVAVLKDLPSAEPERKTDERTAKVEWYPGLTTFTDGICECGERVRDDWKYCPGCGARLEME